MKKILIIFSFFLFTQTAFAYAPICGVGFTTTWVGLNTTWTTTNGTIYHSGTGWDAFLSSDTNVYMIEQTGSEPDTENGGYFVCSTNNILTGTWSGTGGRSVNNPLFTTCSTPPPPPPKPTFFSSTIDKYETPMVWIFGVFLFLAFVKLVLLLVQGLRIIIKRNNPL